MNINVQALCDNCARCPRLEIETVVDLWGTGENGEEKIYDKIFACKHYEDCLIIAEMIGRKDDQARTKNHR